MNLITDIKRVRSLLRPERGPYSVGLLALLLVNVADVIAPLMMAVAIDLTVGDLTGQPAQSMPILRWLGLTSNHFTMLSAVLVFLGLRLLSNTSRYPMLMYTAVPSHRIGQRLRNRLVDHLLRLSRPFYDRTRSGDLMSLATADIMAVRMTVGPGLIVGADAMMLFSFVISLMALMSWQLTLIALIPVPIIILFTNRISHAEYESFEAVQKGIADLTERTRESYAGIRIIQGYAVEDFDRNRFRQHSQAHYLRTLRLAKIKALFDPTLEFMLGASTTLVVVFGGFAVIRHDVTLGTFLAFIFLIRYLAGPMIGFGWAVSLFQRGRASIHRLDTFWGEPIEIQDTETAQEADGPGAISIRGLSFSYDGRRIENDNNGVHREPSQSGWPSQIELTDRDNGGVTKVTAIEQISVDVPAGSTLGVIGPVGSGKSTLVSLLVRLYDPPPKSVFLDGVDVRDLSLSSLRRHVVVAPQDTFLFSDTVARNIGLAAKAGANVHDFARLAQVDEELSSLVKGYNTLLGERGVNLSGGQRQRVAIARAIAANPKVLVLDDVLSAVDAGTEDTILKNLRDVFAGRTGIIVSHRVRAVASCDQIIVFEQGRVAERGSHDDLLGAGGFYAEIAEQQMKRDETP